MDRKELERYITDTYGAEPEYPWKGEPSYAVFRHELNRKWFAVIMEIPAERLGRADGGLVNIINLKCETALIGSMLQETGIYPAYHMNKDHWISAVIDENISDRSISNGKAADRHASDGSASDESIIMLLDLSFSLTAPKLKRARKN